MGNILNRIIENNILFTGVIIVLCVILIILILLIIKTFRNNKKINIYEEELEDEDIKKVKNVKKEDIIETPNKIKEEVKKVEEKVEQVEEDENTRLLLEEELDEIEEKYAKEKEQEFEEVKEENHSSEIAELLSRMEEDSKLKPEDVVANFEKEQEAQSIISYKELVNAVKNRQEDYYEDELESLPLATVSDYMKQRKEKENNEIENEQFDIETEEIEELTPKEENTSSFRNTDVISPVFGIVSSNNETRNTTKTKKEDSSIDKTIDLRDIDLSDSDFINVNKEQKTNSDSLKELDAIYKQMAKDLFENNEELKQTTSLDELTRNEEFLQSLKDFRKKL